MVEIHKKEDKFIFEIKGMHKLWAFKSQLEIPKAHILKVHRDFSVISEWKGFRMPGTYVPYLITAGTFYAADGKTFWDVMNKEKSIIVELKDEDYQQLIVEVENPEEAMFLFSEA